MRRLEVTEDAISALHDREDREDDLSEEDMTDL